MRQTAKLSLLGFLSAALGFSQVNFTATKITTLSAAAEAITIQQPATSGKNVQFVSAFVYCSVSCVITLSRDGGAATSTALTPKNVNGREPTVTAAAFSSSNVGTGTTLSTIPLGAGGSVVLDLSAITFIAKQTQGTNFTISTSSISGDVYITIQWRES